MTLEEIRRACVESTTDDWSEVGFPLYLGETLYYQEPVEGFRGTSGHSRMAVHRQDVGISMLWGHSFAYEASWLDRFNGERGSGEFLDVRYGGGVVERLAYVVVDDGQMVLPVPPSSEVLAVGRWEMGMICLLASFSFDADAFDRYVQLGGLQIS